MQPIYLIRIYNDTMNLLAEARNYAIYYDIHKPPQGIFLQIRITFECFRVTNRLIHVMAWLLAQKAVYTGEFSQERAASDAFALSGGTSATDPSGPDDESLPRGLRILLDRSHKLYMRVSRIEKQLKDNLIVSTKIPLLVKMYLL